MQTPEHLIKIKEVISMTAISRTMIYDKIKKGVFPKPIRLGPRATAWRLSQIQEWILSRETAQ